jgi:hypothetical protein
VKIVVHERKEASEVHRSLSSCSSFRVISEIKLHYYQKKKKTKNLLQFLLWAFHPPLEICAQLCVENRVHKHSCVI